MASVLIQNKAKLQLIYKNISSKSNIIKKRQNMNGKQGFSD